MVVTLGICWPPVGLENESDQCSVLKCSNSISLDLGSDFLSSSDKHCSLRNSSVENLQSHNLKETEKETPDSPPKVIGVYSGSRRTESIQEFLCEPADKSTKGHRWRHYLLGRAYTTFSCFSFLALSEPCIVSWLIDRFHSAEPLVTSLVIPVFFPQR